MTPTRLIGIILLAVGALFLLISAFSCWSAWNRWSAVSHVRAARARMVDAYDDSVRRHGAEAAAAQPNEPAAVLIDIDLTKEADYARLETLERRCAADQRGLVRVAEALSLVLRGKPAPDLPGGDGVLLKALAALMNGSKPSAIVLPREEPPHQSVMLATYLAQLRAAFSANDRALVRDAADALGLLVPNSPDGPAIALICGALDPNFDPKMLQTISTRVTDEKLRRAVLHDVAMVAPDRALLLDAIASGQAPGTTPGKILEATVRASLASDGADALPLARRCFDAGRPDLAKLLLPKLPADAQAAFRNLVLNQEGDVAELAKSGNPALMPRVTTPRGRPGLIAFHLTNDLGMVPKTELKVRIDGEAVSPDKITHTGTLYSIETPSSGAVQLEVHVGPTVFFNGKVTL
jgi:hypothetical protein